MKLAAGRRKIFVCVLLLLCGMNAGSARTAGPPLPESAIPLPPETAIAGTVTSEIRYQFEVEGGEYFRLSVEKTGTDAALSLVGPDNQAIRTVSCSQQGLIQVSEIASGSGLYTVRLTYCDRDGPGLPYQILLSTPRTALPSDRLRVEAERLSAEGDLELARYRFENRSGALQKYEEAQVEWAATGDRSEEVRTLLSIAALRQDAGEWERALEAVETALQLATSPPDFASEAAALLTLSTIRLNRGEIDSALDSALKARELSRASFDGRGEAEANLVLGNIYYFPDPVKAISLLEDAQRFFTASGDRSGAAWSMLRLATIACNMNRYDETLEAAGEALAIFRSLGDKSGEGKTLTLLANTQSKRGLGQDALNLYEEARLIVVDSGDLIAETMILTGFANARLSLGEPEEAKQSFQAALPKFRALGDRSNVAYTLLGLGECFWMAGDTREALNHYNQAHEALRELGDQRGQAWVLRDIGMAYEDLGQTQAAFDYFNQALAMDRKDPNLLLQTLTLISIGHIHEGRGEVDRALQYYKRAQGVSDVADDPAGQLEAIYRIAFALRLKGMFADAIAALEPGLRRIETFRASVASPALRTSYFATVRQQYELYVDLLMQLHREGDLLAVQAFEAGERSRARTLVDSIGETSLSIAEGADPRLIEAQAKLRTLLDNLSQRYNQLLSTETDPSAIRTLSDEIRSRTAEYDQVQGQIRVRSPQYAAFVQPAPLTLAVVQNEILDDDSLLLEYSLGEDASYLWAVTRKDFTSYVLPGRSVIEEKVRSLSESMARFTYPGGTDYAARVKAAENAYALAAAELSRILLGPVASRLGENRLVIVAEGALQYLPFGALPEPQSTGSSSAEPLVVRHEIVNLPSASTLAVIRSQSQSRGTPDKMIAVFADPVFETADTRVRQTGSTLISADSQAVPASRSVLSPTEGLRGASAHLPRLPATQLEARAVLDMVPKDRRLEALGFNATRAAALSPDLKRYRIVHFATHTLLNDDHPELSSLVLSLVDENGAAQDGYLWLRDMYGLKLSADLVVLSACDTGIGKDVTGEGLMSMVRGFMYSGTPRVLASLWKVDDDATRELMEEFYKQHLRNGLSPSAALRQAQIAQMKKKARQSPFYWAAFQVHGEWH